MIMERKIGEIFEYNSEWYQAIDNTNSIMCSRCTFVNEYNECEADISVVGNCGCKDGNPLIFKKLEKVGEPYPNADKLCQLYKLPMNIEKLPLHTEGINLVRFDIVEIELKQTKEDMEEKKQNLKPFDLEKARLGKPVCTRDGRKARIICFDKKGDYPIVALVNDYNNEEYIKSYDKFGKKFIAGETTDDLMMLPEKKEGWVNVYKGGLLDTKSYPTKKEAFDKVCLEGYVDTVKIEWEE